MNAAGQNLPRLNGRGDAGDKARARRKPADFAELLLQRRPVRLRNADIEPRVEL